MSLVDANLLIYAFMEGVPQHRASRDWLEGLLRGDAKVGLPWSSLLAFVRVVSNRRIFERPATIMSSWRQVEEWLRLESVWIPQPTARHRDILGRVLRQAGTDANRVPDTHLVALALEHRLVLYTADRGFGRYTGLRWENPLAPEVP